MTAKIHVKKGDTIVVLSGKDKDRRGKVLSVFPSESKVLVDGINIVKRHTKPTRTNPQGGVMEKPAPINSSKVMVICSNCGEPTRIAKSVATDGERVRKCKKCGRELDK